MSSYHCVCSRVCLVLCGVLCLRLQIAAGSGAQPSFLAAGVGHLAVSTAGLCGRVLSPTIDRRGRAAVVDNAAAGVFVVDHDRPHACMSEREPCGAAVCVLEDDPASGRRHGEMAVRVRADGCGLRSVWIRAERHSGAVSYLSVRHSKWYFPVIWSLSLTGERGGQGAGIVVSCGCVFIQILSAVQLVREALTVALSMSPCMVPSSCSLSLRD